MSETLKHQRSISLITLEGLRDFVKSKTPFEYEFVLVGFSAASGVPQYQMLVYAKDEKYILVVSKVDKAGPKIRLLLLYPAITSIHQEFGKGSPLRVSTNKENVCEKIVCYSAFVSLKKSPTPLLLASLFLLYTSPTQAEVLTFANDTTRQSNLSAGVLKFDTNGHFITSELPHQTNNTATVSPSVWKAQSDEYLTDVIKRWGKEAGYTVIATGTGAWQLKVPLTKVGSFEEALEHVIKGFSSQGHPPSVRVFSNKVIKIGSAL